MKIVAMSDTHGQHENVSIPKGDVLVFAGDWTRGRDLGLQETSSFLEWLSNQSHKHKILVAGNHEVAVENNRRFHHMISTYPEITYLENHATTINDIKFYGSPYSNEFCNWAFMEDELELKAIWEKIPDDTQVLITHGPAYKHKDLVKEGLHVGSTTLRDRKNKIQNLMVHICGHIHEAHGSIDNGVHTTYNVAILNEKYKLTNKPTVITL